MYEEMQVVYFMTLKCRKNTCSVRFPEEQLQLQKTILLKELNWIGPQNVG